MKKLALSLGAVLVLSACTPQTEEDKQRNHELRMAKIASQTEIATSRPIMPVAPGNYIDYRGNPSYGYWDYSGRWRWTDPNSIYAVQSRSYVDYQIATGVLAAGMAGMLTRDAWERDNRSGWKKTTIINKTYISTKGEPISKKQYESRSTAAKAKQSKWVSNRTKSSTYSKEGIAKKRQFTAKKTVPTKSVSAKPAYNKSAYSKPAAKPKSTYSAPKRKSSYSSAPKKTTSYKKRKS